MTPRLSAWSLGASIAPLMVFGCAACVAPAMPSVFSVPGDFATIQAAINASSDGDTVLVAPGTYNEAIDLGATRVALRSAAGPEATKIQIAGNTITNVGGGAEVSGFTIEGCCGLRVFGVGAVISGNIFDGATNPTTSFAIQGNIASPIITGNVFRNQRASGGVVGGVVRLINNSSPLIANNIFEGNTGVSVNLTLPAETNPRVINNTFVNNEIAIRVDRRVDSSNLRDPQQPDRRQRGRPDGRLRRRGEQPDLREQPGLRERRGLSNDRGPDRRERESLR